MVSIDERIEKLRNDMLPLQKLYGLGSKTIEERYLELKVKQTIKNRPKVKLPKL